MAYEIEFAEMDEKQKDDTIDTMQKISAIEAELVKIADERANSEAAWRARENFLNTEKGKFQIHFREIRSAQIKGSI